MSMKYTIETLIGIKCKHGSPGYTVANPNGMKCTYSSAGFGITAVIEAIFPYTGQLLNGIDSRKTWQINFESGFFTYLTDKALQALLQKGETYYGRAAGFSALEMIEVMA